MGKDLCVKGIYGSGMVLQRDKINCIYGTGDVFSDVIMSFRGVTSIAQVDENGEWKFEFSPGDAGGPFNMVIKSDAQKIEFTDIYVGEVWLNAGEGNAKLSMGEMKYSYPEEFSLPENPKVRMISVPVNYSFNEKIDYVKEVKWQAVSPSTIEDMSGLGYFFGKKLSVDLGVPVGIINVAFKNTPICSWLSKKALEEMGDKSGDLETMEYFKVPENLEKTEKMSDEVEKWHNELAKTLPEIDFNSDEGWTSLNIPGTVSSIDDEGVVWLKKDIQLSEEQVDNFCCCKGGSGAGCCSGAGAVNSNSKGFCCEDCGGGKKANLWLGFISCPEEVFFNGKMVGSTCDVTESRRFEVPVELLVPGKNTILIKLQKNEKEVRFYEESPYCLFSDNVFVAPCVYRNIGMKDQSLAPIDGENISLEGEWKLKVGAVTGNSPKTENLIGKPTALFNGILPACFKYAIAGVIWTQGESDFDRACEYKGLLTKLITLWRRRFTYWSRDLPFVIVQLPNWANGGKEGDLAVNSNMATIRKAQADVSEIIDKVGLVISIDAGEWNNLYSEKKLTIGTRCEFEALRIAYGKTYISPAPKMSSFDIDDKKYIVKFDCGNSSLHAFCVNGMAAELTREDKDCRVYGFSYLCKNGGEEVVINAPAKLSDPFTVEVPVPEECRGMEIVALRYLWADNPAPVNLYSRDMIPAGPFTISAK